MEEDGQRRRFFEFTCTKGLTEILLLSQDEIKFVKRPTLIDHIMEESR